MISVLSKATPSDIQTDPFPHLVVRDALPQTLYDCLAQTFPAAETIIGSRAMGNNKLFLMSARNVIDNPSIADSWREFFAYHTSRAFFQEVVALWKDYIDEAYPGIESDFGKPLVEFTTDVRDKGGRENPANLAEDIQLDCQFGINSSVEERSSVRGPHVDSRYKLFAGLLYFREKDDDSTGGALDLCRFRNRDVRYQRGEAVDPKAINRLPARRLGRIPSGNVERVASVPYAANVLVMWLNAPYATHGVSPRPPTRWVRRYVNLLGEMYGGSNDGFFQASRRRRMWPF